MHYIHRLNVRHLLQNLNAAPMKASCGSSYIGTINLFVKRSYTCILYCITIRGVYTEILCGGAKPPPRKILSILEIYLLPPPPHFNVFTRI